MNVIVYTFWYIYAWAFLLGIYLGVVLLSYGICLWVTLKILLSRFQFSSVQSLSHVWLFVTPRTAARQASLVITNSQSLLKLMSIELVMPSNHLILCRPLLLLPSIFPSTRVFSNESVLHIRWWKYWSFSFNISPSNEHPGLTSFRMDWLDLLLVQRILKNLLQHHSSKASILQHSAFFIVQLSHTHMTTGKIIALTRHYFANKEPSSQSSGFSSGHVWMWELDYKESWVQRTDAFELWCWRLSRVP